jgi:hypothetical protein
MLASGVRRSSTTGPVHGRRDGSFGSRHRVWLVHEWSLESRLLIRDRMACLEARLDGVGSLGSGLHRERKWIQLVRGRRYHRDTGWAEKGEQGVRRGWGLVHELEGMLAGSGFGSWSRRCL